MREALEEARPGSGFDSTNDYVVAILERAQEAGLWPLPGSSGQDELPISA